MRRLAFVVLLGVVIGVGAAVWLRRTLPAPLAAGSSPAAAKTEDEKRTAEILSANANLPGDPELFAAYQSINAEYFENRLPPIRLRWESRLDEIGPMIADGFRMSGVTDRKLILLNPSLQRDPAEFRRVLCHEIVHIAVVAEREPHGPVFQQYLRQLLAKGAFTGIIASDEEKRQRRSELDRESSDLAAETELLARTKAQIERETPADATGAASLNDRIQTYNDRVRRHNDAVVEFNRSVEEYNLMVTYPDGLDRERLARRAPVAAGS